MEVHSGTFNPTDFAWQGLTLTPALPRISAIWCAKQPDMKGRAAGRENQGCAGFGYVLEMIAEPDKDDLLFESTARSCLSRCKRCRLSTAPKSISFVKDLIRYL